MNVCTRKLKKRRRNHRKPPAATDIFLPFLADLDIFKNHLRSTYFIFKNTVTFVRNNVLFYFSGEIYIDNVNISQLELEELREHLAIIPQQPFLFRNII